MLLRGGRFGVQQPRVQIKKRGGIKQRCILGQNATFLFWEVFLEVNALKAGVRVPTSMPVFSLITKRYLSLHGHALDRIEEARIDCRVTEDCIASMVMTSLSIEPPSAVIGLKEEAHVV
jgi:hypothetical protein